jgi:ankyrin repeat protein
MPPKTKTNKAAAGAGAPAPPARPYRLPVSGLEVRLLDVGRFVALNGYAHECRLLPFLSRAFRREADFLVACKHVRYGPKQRTRLMSVARAGDVERVALLLKVRADVEARDARGWRPLHVASGWGREAVVRQLLERGADVRAATTGGATPLHLASLGGHESIVRLLLDRGADVDARDGEGRTALLLAGQAGHRDVVRLLVEAARR